MVISHTNNLIFLRIPKNASTSVAHYFIKRCDKQTDKWTEIGEAGIRHNRIPERVLHKYAFQYRHLHLTLQEILDAKLITDDQALNMKKIAIIRNPLHRQLSLYFFLCRNRPKSPEDFRAMFSQGKHNSDANNAITQSSYVALNGEMAPNADLWRYDDLNTKINDLDRFKSSYLPKAMSTLENIYYDEPTREAVLSYYREDVELYATL